MLCDEILGLTNVIRRSISSKVFTLSKAIFASRFTDWYGDVHENIQEADLIGSCWKFGVDEYNSDIFGGKDNTRDFPYDAFLPAIPFIIFSLSNLCWIDK